MKFRRRRMWNFRCWRRREVGAMDRCRRKEIELLRAESNDVKIRVYLELNWYMWGEGGRFAGFNGGGG